MGVPCSRLCVSILIQSDENGTHFPNLTVKVHQENRGTDPAKATEPQSDTPKADLQFAVQFGVFIVTRSVSEALIDVLADASGYPKQRIRLIFLECTTTNFEFQFLRNFRIL